MTVATTLGLSAILGASGLTIARGSTRAVDVPPEGMASAPSSNSGTYGWEFPLDKAVIVTGLGVFSYTSAPLQNSYPVAIWNWFPTGAPLVEATVNAPIVHYLSERDSNTRDPGDPQLKVPTFNDNGSNGYFGPNFQFGLAPEPSYLGLLFVAGVGLTALAAIQRRRRSARFGIRSLTVAPPIRARAITSNRNAHE